MPHRAIRALEGILSPHVSLSKSRLETLCLLAVGMVSDRTVNLGHIATERPGTALTASTYRRLQRFFQHVRLDQDWALPLIAKLLGLTGSWYLALDRTQWKIGRREVNYLVLAVIRRSPGGRSALPARTRRTGVRAHRPAQRAPHAPVLPSSSVYPAGIYPTRLFPQRRRTGG